MTMLLITGAGASTSLGRADKPLPLMRDRASALCASLEDSEAGLAAICGLDDGMDGEAFEEAIGALLEWQQVRSLEKRFAGLGTSPLGSGYQPIVEARDRMSERLSRVMDAVNRTLYLGRYAQSR